MKLTEARKLATTAMAEHGLTDKGWRFEFDNAKRRFGCCHTSRRLITISRHLTELNNPLVVYNTILHEVAHALTPYDRGHGREWRQVARGIGCDANRCYSGAEVATPPKPFRGTCPSCGRVILRHKRNKIACGRCCNSFNGGRFNSDYLFNWERV